MHLFSLNPLCFLGYVSHLCERIVYKVRRSTKCSSKTGLTEHSASGNRFTVQPEGDLRQNDSHDAREVGLNHKVADFPFQMEICCHHYIFAWVRGGKKRERDTHTGVREARAGIFKDGDIQVQPGIQKKKKLKVDSGHHNEWSVGIGWPEYITCLGTFQRDVTIDNFSLKKKPNPNRCISYWHCLSALLPAVLWPLTVKIAPKHQPFYAMSVICAAKIWEKHSATPRGGLFFAGKIQTGAEMAPTLVFPLKFTEKYDLFTGSSRSSVR